jgi:hypothetical protein
VQRSEIFGKWRREKTSAISATGNVVSKMFQRDFARAKSSDIDVKPLYRSLLTSLGCAPVNDILIKGVLNAPRRLCRCSIIVGFRIRFRRGSCSATTTGNAAG